MPVASTLLLVFGGIEMTREIHRVVENSEDLDHVFIAVGANAKHDQMPALPARPGNVQRSDVGTEILASARARHARARRQRRDRPHQGHCVDAGLPGTEVLDGPDEDVLEVRFRGPSQADRPAGGPPRHFRRFRDGDAAIVSSANEARCRSSADGDRNVRTRPASASAIPIRIASRSASARVSSSAARAATSRSPSRSTSLEFW
jgi:hypothetical protein